MVHFIVVNGVSLTVMSLSEQRKYILPLFMTSILPGLDLGSERSVLGTEILYD